jgi:glucosyl-dolichyl phosphate glucuronosyltransferase
MLSVVVSTLNRSQLLSQALHSILQQSVAADQFEVLIIDNGSTDATAAVVQEFRDLYAGHQIRYFYEPEPGLLSGRHLGAKESQGEILVFTDDDIIADRDWLASIIETFNDSSIDLVGGRNLPNYETEPPDWLNWFWYECEQGRHSPYLSLQDYGDQAFEINPGLVWGLNFSIRKQTLFRVGGFNPDFLPKHLQQFQGDGEVGLTVKAMQAGCRAMYQPQALIRHLVSPSRMTLSYFEQRSFAQGVSDSYASIRKDSQNSLRRSLKEPVKSLQRSLNHRLTRFKWRFLNPPISLEQQRMLEQLDRSYRAGYSFHQRGL